MKFKSAKIFIVYYFNNIMEIRLDKLGWSAKDRANEMRGLIYEYKKAFRLEEYSNVQIWKMIIRFYNKHWDELHYEMMEYEKNHIYNKH